MLVNLYDSTFSHDICSTAWKTPKYIQYTRNQDNFDGVTLFVDGFAVDGTAERVNSRYKMAWFHEPPELHPAMYSPLTLRTGTFDKILTYLDGVLDASGSRGRYCPYAGCWLNESDWGLKSKTTLCTMLVGSKLATSGHRLRRATAEHLQARNLPVTFYGSIGTPTDYSIKTKLDVNAAAAFTIVTETQMLDGLWTEWLLDALAVGTVPIYAGAGDIGRWFNENGILSFTTPAECVDIVAGLSFDLYESMLPAVADNLARVGQYSVCEDWLYANVLKEYDHA